MMPALMVTGIPKSPPEASIDTLIDIG
jgi:hypothetical protein